LSEPTKPEKTGNLSGLAKHLRKSMTKEEKHLWYDFLKLLPVTVNRQRIIGKYIVDFYCSSAKTVIEIDGAQHYEEDSVEYDRQRDDYLNNLGYTVLRYTNHDIKFNFSSVCRDIKDHFGIE